MIKIGILGYGNLGKGVEAAIKKNDDTELVAVYTRRDQKKMTINTDNLSVEAYYELLEKIQKDYGVTRNEAYEILEHEDPIVEKIIEKGGMGFEV